MVSPSRTARGAATRQRGPATRANWAALSPPVIPQQAQPCAAAILRQPAVIEQAGSNGGAGIFGHYTDTKRRALSARRVITAQVFDFYPLFGGRTRARTWDTLIKSPRRGSRRQEAACQDSARPRPKVEAEAKRKAEAEAESP
jgi:hypothetical protein